MQSKSPGWIDEERLMAVPAGQRLGAERYMKHGTQVRGSQANGAVILRPKGRISAR